MRSHTVSAEGGAAGVIASGRQPGRARLRHHLRRRLAVRSGCRRSLRQRSAPGAPAPRALGLPLEPGADGRIAVRPFGGMKKMRTWFAADKTGFHMLHTLFQTSLKYPSVVRYDEWFVTRLLVDDGRVQGVVAIDLKSGRIEAITARAVILCTGGCGRVFPFTTNAASRTATGWRWPTAPARRSRTWSSSSTIPTGLPVHRHPDHRGRAGRGRLSDQQGRLSLPAGLQPGQAAAAAGAAQHGARSARSPVAGVHEGAGEGRTIETPYGPVVHLDLRHLGEKKINAKIPFVRELCLKYQNLDPGQGADSGAAGRSLHDGRRPHRHQRRHAAAGPYAAGEVACVSINGANRLGSNSLPELLVFGARPARAAAELRLHARASIQRRSPRRPDEQRRLERRPAEQDRARAHRRPPRRRCRRRWRRAPASTARARRWRGVEQAAPAAGALRATSPSTTGADVQHRAHRRTGAVVHARRRRGDRHRRSRREESRGAHQRTDFPEARRRTLPRALADLPQPDGSTGWSTCR